MPNRNSKWILPILAMLLLLFLLIRQLFPVTSGEDFVYTEEHTAAVGELQPSEPEPTVEIIVHVAGEVKVPGVYTLEKGKRVEDALELAGILPEADIDALNRAAVLSDGQKIVVPSKNAKNSQINSASANDGLVNLNQADLAQLMELPGIGEVKAQAILDYRAQHGSFSCIEEIQQVSGIGEAIYSQIKNKIKI